MSGVRLLFQLLSARLLLLMITAVALGDATLIKFVIDHNRTASYQDFYNNGEEDKVATAVEARFQRSGKLRHFLTLADQPQKP